LESIESDIVHAIYKVDVVRQQQPARRVVQTNRSDNGASQQPAKRSTPAVGRNDPCWCGSGKKYKHCHMRTDQVGEGAPPQKSAAPQPAGSAPAGKNQAASKRRRARR
jgi:preprotein translocase subunit SecA